MDEAQWCEPDIYTLGVFLNGKASFRYGTWNERIIDDSFLLLLNGGTSPAQFTLPGAPWATEYRLVIDTSNVLATTAEAISRARMPGDAIQLQARSVIVLRTRPPNE
jgi:glycogen operon protein